MGLFKNIDYLIKVGQLLFSDKDVDGEILKSMPNTDSKSIIEDPLSVVSSLGYKDKPSALTYTTLSQMSTRNSVISSIITTRVNQVSTFTKPSRYTKDGVGFQISMRNPNIKPTEEQRQFMLALETFIDNCGFDYNPGRDSFDTFMRKVVRDSLVYDQMCFEIVPDRVGRPAEIYAVDASTIRASSLRDEKDSGEYVLASDPSSRRGVQWVQIINNSPIAEFTGKELAFAVRNPRTDINVQPYGFSELEVLIHQVTAHLWAEEYNSKYFSQGGTTKGILNLKGANITRDQLAAFRRQWTAQVSGVNGAWKTPVVSVDGLEYLNVSQSNREMEYEMWMNYLINICCSIAGTKILSPQGKYTNVEELCVGDTVITHTGGTGEIVKLSSREYTGYLYTITYSPTYFGKEQLTFTDEHPFYIKRDGVLQWVMSKDLTLSDKLTLPRRNISRVCHTLDLYDYFEDTKNMVISNTELWFKTSPRVGSVTLKQVANEAGITVNTLRAHRCNSPTSSTRLSKDTVSKINRAYENLGYVEPTPIKIPRYIEVTEDFARLLGLYVAEGFTINNGVRFAFGIQDYNNGTVDFVVRCIRDIFGLECSVRAYGNNYDVTIHSLYLHKILPTMCGAGAHNKFVPDFMYSCSIPVQREFIRGYIDGDGHFPINPNKAERVRATTVSSQLATGLHLLLADLGILASIGVRDNTNKDLLGTCKDYRESYEIAFGGEYTKELYPEYNIQKGSNLYARDENYFYLNITDISKEYTNDTMVYNCEVEGDHSYIANGVAVHNCAVYQIDPAEINFPNRGGSSGRGGGLGEGGIEDRLKNSRDKGLRPLLRFIEDTMNRYVVRQFSDDFTFNFVGLDPESEDEKSARQDKQVRTYMTINELRKSKDMDSIEGGDIILDPTYTNYRSQLEQQKQMEQMEQGEPSMEGEESGEQGTPDARVAYEGQEEAPEQNAEDIKKQQEDNHIMSSMDENL